MSCGKYKIDFRLLPFLLIFTLQCVLLICILQCAFFPHSLLAQDGTWITVEGKASMANRDMDTARSLAIEDAVHEAAAKVVGAAVSPQTLMVNLRLSGSIIGAIPHGRVVDRKILDEGVKNLQKEDEDMPSSIYWVRMKARVVEETQGTDSHFGIEASLNHTSFKDGDEMQIRIKPTRDCYVSIYNILEDDKVIRLVPNQFKKENLAKAGEIFSFPDENDTKRGITLKVHTPEHKDAVAESMYILALRQPLNLEADKLQEGLFGVYNGQTAFMTDLIREIVSIPLSERSEKLIPYQVNRIKSKKSKKVNTSR